MMGVGPDALTSLVLGARSGFFFRCTPERMEPLYRKHSVMSDNVRIQGRFHDRI